MKTIPCLLHLYDVNNDPHVFLGRCRFHNGADRFCDTSLLSDDLSHVTVCHVQFEHCGFAFFFLGDRHFIRIVNETLSRSLQLILSL